MKDHYQLAAELLQYRDEYEAKQRKKKLYAVWICAAVLCCGAVLAAAGHAVSRSPKPAETTFTETATESRNIININRVSAALGDNGRKMNICLGVDDRVELDADGMNAYCGTNIFPEVPSDLTAWQEQEKQCIYKRDGGVGEVYYDTFILNYSSEDGSRTVNLECSKGKYPFNCVAIWSDDENIKKSVINGENVTLIYDGDMGIYYSEFMHNGVGFRIIAENLTSDEVVNVVSSLTKR